MIITTRTTHTIQLDVAERFEWTKTEGKYSGHAFTVERIVLEMDGERSSVALRGPWTVPPKDTDLAGWQYLLSQIPEDMATLRKLPTYVLEVLAACGLGAAL